MYNHVYNISSVQSLSHVRLFATPWIAACQASLSVTNSRSSLRLTSIESVMPSTHLILCRPLLLLPPIPPSIRVFSNESTLHMRWPKYIGFIIFKSYNPSIVIINIRFIGYILHIVQYILRPYLIPNKIPLNRVLPSATDELKLPRYTRGNKIRLPPFSIPNSRYLWILYPTLPFSSLSLLVCFHICELAYLCSVVSYF